MQDGGRMWRLAVSAGSDTLRQERLTRDLHEALRNLDDLSVGFVDNSPSAKAGRKGAGTGDIALWAAAAAASRPVSQILITLIKEWSAKERHRKVDVSYEGHSVTITGRPDADQERMVREFLDKVAGSRGGGPEGGAE
ncbi:hypothetical protein RKE29_23700 [Streptomyces sp. B1866]|uniref:hypothetical protein n=1 Tax=Streptomyces sp. B1866 TaxID=3075431 RepID=UPI00288FB39A|nr:hypothetical protein [Streptomyces sp. B1866]MDT3399610.1 hypothetical protein [Streptomyces sp. B1866]